ncbi:hypothetical protein ALC56_02756 [Trachymyrmex septentrionalis]|uniref:Uncharacterized protein n=1 Tax=Trachymyrmex septentrionalis TaxID=34720 RepID=A0A195FRN8_9HYME|nr:hypothetical protein ALC56_02756 [Trachymyrmex septentrionalis]
MPRASPVGKREKKKSPAARGRKNEFVRIPCPHVRFREIRPRASVRRSARSKIASAIASRKRGGHRAEAEGKRGKKNKEIS